MISLTHLPCTLFRSFQSFAKPYLSDLVALNRHFTFILKKWKRLDKAMENQALCRYGFAFMCLKELYSQCKSVQIHRR